MLIFVFLAKIDTFPLLVLYKSDKVCLFVQKKIGHVFIFKKVGRGIFTCESLEIMDEMRLIIIPRLVSDFRPAVFFRFNQLKNVIKPDNTSVVLWS